MPFPGVCWPVARFSQPESIHRFSVGDLRLTVAAMPGALADEARSRPPVFTAGSLAIPVSGDGATFSLDW
jgi:hypothetical protein